MIWTDVLLVVVACVGVTSIIQAEIRHKEMMVLLNSFATMVGELFPLLKEDDEDM